MTNSQLINKILLKIDFMHNQSYKLKQPFVIDNITCTHIVLNDIEESGSPYKWVVCNEDWEVSLLTELTNKELIQLYKIIKNDT